MTAAAVVKDAAKREVEYHGIRYRQAQEVLAAIETGKPFEHLLGDPDTVYGNKEEAD